MKILWHITRSDGAKGSSDNDVNFDEVYTSDEAGVCL
jgi:hypothetical protein